MNKSPPMTPSQQQCVVIGTQSTKSTSETVIRKGRIDVMSYNGWRTMQLNSSLKNAAFRAALPRVRLDFHLAQAPPCFLTAIRRLEAAVSSARDTPLRTALLAERVQPGGAVASRPIRTRLYALPTSQPCRLTRSVPRTFTRRRPPISFIHPMHSSTRLRILWLTW